MAERKRIVIVGAGFGGVKLAKLFAKENVQVTIVDRNNFHLFQPLLYQVSTAVLATDEIAYPIRSFFRDRKNVDLCMARAEGIDKNRKVLLTDQGEIPYDYLVLAAGATTNFFGMKNVEAHSFGMKTLQEAIQIRNHVLHMFERANMCPHDAEAQKRMMTFVVVGGGPTGIEESGAISELIDVMKKEFHDLDFNGVHVKLIEAMDCVLPMVAPNLREYTVKVLQRKGVDVMLNTQVVDYDGNDLKLKDGTTIPTNTVIWAAGVKAVPFIATCGEADRAGRVIVNEKLQIGDSDSIFAIGDCANFQHGTERPLPTVAPVATQQAQAAYENIMRLIRGERELKDFHYKDLGSMATIGRGEAVVDKTSMNPQLTGFIAWCAWMFVHLLRLAGAHANFTVALKWTWNLFSGTRLGRIITNTKA
ncbi:MAG: NAD(P)/FAD-dependent oxidoreductase [Mitsuokella sp.]